MIFILYHNITGRAEGLVCSHIYACRKNMVRLKIWNGIMAQEDLTFWVALSLSCLLLVWIWLCSMFVCLFLESITRMRRLVGIGYIQLIQASMERWWWLWKLNLDKRREEFKKTSKKKRWFYLFKTVRKKRSS